MDHLTYVEEIATLTERLRTSQLITKCASLAEQLDQGSQTPNERRFEKTIGNDMLFVDYFTKNGVSEVRVRYNGSYPFEARQNTKPAPKGIIRITDDAQRAWDVRVYRPGDWEHLILDLYAGLPPA